jgi:hypothetical protein
MQLCFVCPVTLSCVLIVLFQLIWSGCSLLSDLPWLLYPSSPVLAVRPVLSALSWQSYPGSHVLPVLSYSVCPALAVLSSCPIGCPFVSFLFCPSFYPSSPVLAVLFCLSSLGFPTLAVLSCLVLAALFCLVLVVADPRKVVVLLLGFNSIPSLSGREPSTFTFWIEEEERGRVAG